MSELQTPRMLLGHHQPLKPCDPRRCGCLGIVLHITERKTWENADSEGHYAPDTLRTQGFIHCSTPTQILEVANAGFRGRRGLVLLCIDSGRVESEIRYEELNGKRYPHIYGPLNLDAVTGVLTFEPDENGKFRLPKELAHHS